MSDQSPWADLKIAAKQVGNAFAELSELLRRETALRSAAFAYSMGVPLTVSRVVPEDQAYIMDGRIVVGVKVMFVLTHPELKGWDLAEAWIAHKIHGSYVEALARHEDRCDRLEAAHRGGVER